MNLIILYDRATLLQDRINDTLSKSGYGMCSAYYLPISGLFSLEEINEVLNNYTYGLSQRQTTPTLHEWFQDIGGLKTLLSHHQFYLGKQQQKN